MPSPWSEASIPSSPRLGIPLIFSQLGAIHHVSWLVIRPIS